VCGQVLLSAHVPVGPAETAAAAPDAKSADVTAVSSSMADDTVPVDESPHAPTAAAVRDGGADGEGTPATAEATLDPAAPVLAPDAAPGTVGVPREGAGEVPSRDISSVEMPRGSAPGPEAALLRRWGGAGGAGDDSGSWRSGEASVAAEAGRSVEAVQAVGGGRDGRADGVTADVKDEDDEEEEEYEDEEGEGEDGCEDGLRGLSLSLSFASEETKAFYRRLQVRRARTLSNHRCGTSHGFHTYACRSLMRYLTPLSTPAGRAVGATGRDGGGGGAGAGCAGCGG